MHWGGTACARARCARPTHTAVPPAGSVPKGSRRDCPWSARASVPCQGGVAGGYCKENTHTSSSGSPPGAAGGARGRPRRPGPPAQASFGAFYRIEQLILTTLPPDGAAGAGQPERPSIVTDANIRLLFDMQARAAGCHPVSCTLYPIPSCSRCRRTRARVPAERARQLADSGRQAREARQRCEERARRLLTRGGRRMKPARRCQRSPRWPTRGRRRTRRVRPGWQRWQRVAAPARLARLLARVHHLGLLAAHARLARPPPRFVAGALCSARAPRAPAAPSRPAAAQRCQEVPLTGPRPLEHIALNARVHGAESLTRRRQAEWLLSWCRRWATEAHHWSATLV